MSILHFSDKSVPYEVFVTDVATSVAHLLSENRNMPAMISQRKAYAMFGRGNVDRWKKQGKITLHIRPGKVEYLTSELKALQRTQQDSL